MRPRPMERRMRKTTLVLLGALLGATAAFVMTPGQIGLQARAGDAPKTSAADTYRQLPLFGLIVELDGAPVKGLTLQQAVEKMRGPVNTQVRLKIMRKGQDAPLDVSLTRETIRVRSVRYRTEGDDVGYIRITQFNAQVGDELKKAINALSANDPDKIKGYILDLRNNPGGLLDQAVVVSNAFLNRGEIASLRGRNPDEAQRFYPKPGAGDLIKGQRLIVVIDGSTALGA